MFAQQHLHTEKDQTARSRGAKYPVSNLGGREQRSQPNRRHNPPRQTATADAGSSEHCAAWPFSGRRSQDETGVNPWRNR
jgi:hypothetical protein